MTLAGQGLLPPWISGMGWVQVTADVRVDVVACFPLILAMLEHLGIELLLGVV